MGWQKGSQEARVPGTLLWNVFALTTSISHKKKLGLQWFEFSLFLQSTADGLQTMVTKLVYVDNRQVILA